MTTSKTTKANERAVNAVLRRVEGRVGQLAASPEYSEEAIAQSHSPRRLCKEFCREMCGIVLEEIANHILRDVTKAAARQARKKANGRRAKRK
jgi:hypothetical protein